MEGRTDKTVVPLQKLCEECKERPLINPVSRYCPSCLAKRPHRVKGRKKNSDKKVALFNPKERNTTLTIDFGKYEPILKDIEKLAEEEMRPVEVQVIYILKKYMKQI